MPDVIKRDGTKEPFNKEKIENAILKAMKNGSGIVKPIVAKKIADEIEEGCSDLKSVEIPAIELMIYEKLIAKKQKLTARAYEGYRSVREFQRKIVNSTDKEIIELIDGNNEYWKGENANKNPILNTTIRDYMAGITSTDAVRRYLLSPEIVQAHDEGILHFHDADYFIQHMHNCDLINLEDMLQNGTVISETLIESPHSFSTACTVTTQIIAQVASSQYGGQSISLAHLAPFVDVSRQKIRKEVIEEQEQIYKNVDEEKWIKPRKILEKKLKKEKEKFYKDKDRLLKFIDATDIEDIVENRLKKEITKGIQTIQYQLTTLMTTNGQAPFITIFMYLNEAKNEDEKKDLALLIEEMLIQRKQGVKNEDGVFIAPAFPKLIYVTEEDNITEDAPYWYLTKLAAECSAKRLVPDYISEKIMLELKGDVYTCMGCVDGGEIITYKYNNQLYVESFKRMWDRLSDYFEVKRQGNSLTNLYIDLNGVEIYETQKGFVNTNRIIRNLSNEWVNVKLSHGRSLVCTSDHPFDTNNGRKRADELTPNDIVKINPNQYNEEIINFNSEKAWLLGFILCDGCYDAHVTSSIAFDTENDIEDTYKDRMLKYFNSSVKTVERYRGKRGTYKDLCSEGSVGDIIDYLSSKFEGLSKNRRHIPNEVFSWDKISKLNFLAGMIDADGYINPTTHGGSVVQIGSTNKELALQQAALAKSLKMPAAIYQNHYSKKNPNGIRYRVEFAPSEELLTYIISKKKKDNYVKNTTNYTYYEAAVTSINKITNKTDFSYDVTTDSDHFEVSGIYSHNCRSFLTPDRFTDAGIGNIANAKNYEPEKHKYYGRFNQGVVTISLPDIAFSSEGDFDKFWELFEERTELCGTLSDVAPILWQYGALARLGKHEKIDKLLYDGYSTISLGYAGLYECVKYMTGKSHSDEGPGEEFGLKVMQRLNDKCAQWKAAENIDYSLYGTPLESTTYKFAKSLKNRFGKDIFIKLDGFDRNYITNSYHIPVFEPIDAFEKLRVESKFQKLSPGGAISYIETPNMIRNVPALLEVIKYMYENIMYAEINTKSCYCEKCGFDGDIPLVDEAGKLKWKCPNCGNDDNTTMDIAFRVCGYIGTAKNGGNQGRYGDIHDRVYHLDDFECVEDK